MDSNLALMLSISVFTISIVLLIVGMGGIYIAKNIISDQTPQKSNDSLYLGQVARMETVRLQAEIDQLKSEKRRLTDSMIKLGIDPGTGSVVINKPANTARANMLAQMNEAFSLEEVITLCFDLGIDPDIFPYKGSRDKLAEMLIVYIQKRKRNRELTELLVKKRPEYYWPQEW